MTTNKEPKEPLPHHLFDSFEIFPCNSFLEWKRRKKTKEETHWFGLRVGRLVGGTPQHLFVRSFPARVFMDERESGSFKSSLVRKRKKEKKKENIFLFRGWAPPDDVIHSFHQFCTHTHTRERDPKNLFTQFWLEKERKEENLN